MFVFFSMLLLCSFFRLKELFQVKNAVTTSLLFFSFENAKNLGWSDDGKGRKKRGWANIKKKNKQTKQNNEKNERKKEKF